MSSENGSTGLGIAGVLNTLSQPIDPELAEQVALAARSCGCKAAGLALQYGHQQRVPCAYGITTASCESDVGFLRDLAVADDATTVEETSVDPPNGGLLWSDGTRARARFRASALLRLHTGEVVGRLFVIDPRPRTMTPAEQSSLETLALSISRTIELRALRCSLAPTRGPAAAETGRPMMSELAAELSHDLRVPLTAIVASVEMLQDVLGDHPDRAAAALLTSALRAAARMDRMLGQQMGFAQDRTHPYVRDVELNTVVAQLVEDSKPLLEATGAVVWIEELPVVRSDPDAMYSVLQNLLTNSLKFARPEVCPVVRIASRQTHSGWRIWVRDNGVGIPEDRRLDVFSLFTRVNEDLEGHGIGLATVARIVRVHGGRVGAESVPGGGTEIWFELPGQSPHVHDLGSA